LYTLVALGLVGLIGFGSHSMLKYYFQKETDLALQYKMATQLRDYGITPPAELIQAEQSWQTMNTRLERKILTPSQIAFSAQPTHQEDQEDNEEEENVPAVQKSDTPPKQEDELVEDNYDGQLASIYVLPINAKGEIINDPNKAQPLISQDEQATQAALTYGQDLRTIQLTDGTQVRLLTYRTSSANGPVLLQAGRTLDDQYRILERYVLGWLILGSITSVLLGLGSWWLSGRSLSPAQRAWDQQQAFISNASHELRTPLTLIRASTEVGLRSQPGGEEKALLQDILGECDYMNSLVDDLLLLSRLDTHRLKLAHESIALADLLGEIAYQGEKLVLNKGIQLEVGNASGAIWGDRMRMRQVLLILLDNAVRFTPPGGTIRLETIDKRKVHQIFVSDNGSGISPEHLPHIFERFFQANPTGEAQTHTNGLGLSIAKGLIEAQGGQIHVESWVGKGTRVILELPAVHALSQIA
jgi:signal transduction histidine kinase